MKIGKSLVSSVPVDDQCQYTGGYYLNPNAWIINELELQVDALDWMNIYYMQINCTLLGRKYPYLSIILDFLLHLNDFEKY